MMYLVRRNMKVFFRDKAAVFFSFLAVIIILGLYFLFLGNTMQFGLENPEANRQMGDAWIMSGVIAVTGVTTTMGAFGSMVSDKKQGIYKDFYCAPISQSKVAFAYVISTIFVGLITSLFTLVFAEIIIALNGGPLLSFPALLQTLGLIVLSVVSGCSMVFLLVSFFSSENAFTAASSILGTLVGFVAGLYIPIGVLPKAVQAVVKVFPVAHAASLLRQVFFTPLLDLHMSAAPAEAVAGLKEFLGIVFFFNGKAIAPVLSILLLLVVSALFFAFGSWNLSRKDK